MAQTKQKRGRLARVSHRIIESAWQGRGLIALTLDPLTWLHRLYRGLRQILWWCGWNRPVRLPVAVVVVGNLNVGGSGKTPLVMHLLVALSALGWKPGVISRGYGSSSHLPALLGPHSDPLECGDEPTLIRFVTGVPVATGADRVAAARLLLSQHPEVNLIIADDGLQHRRLARDIDICLITGTGLGNGWLLPAGPLRDPVQRLVRVDIAVLNGLVPPVRLYGPFFRMRTSPGSLRSLREPPAETTLERLREQQSEGSLSILALCGIGNPSRFHDGLRAAGLQFDTRSLPDHDVIDASDLGPPQRYGAILITEKDAVKCYRDPVLAQDARIWVVSLVCEVDSGLARHIDTRLRTLAARASSPETPDDSAHGPQTA